MRSFVDEFTPDPATRILDVGGTPLNWDLVDVPSRVVLLNVIVPSPAPPTASNITWAEGDGCALPYEDGAFDVCFSNSTIEHLHTLERQQRFAAEVRRVGRSYYVQTPAPCFPFEPHWLGFFVHWLPKRWQRRVNRYATIYGLVLKPTSTEIEALLDEVRLLSYRELQALFPDAVIRRERLALWTKSYIAVRQAPPVEAEASRAEPRPRTLVAAGS
jgi:hypothetical protein